MATHDRPSYEKKDLSAKAIGYFSMGLLLLLGLTILVSKGVLEVFQRRDKRLEEGVSVFAGKRGLPPAPRLQARPKADLIEFRLREDRVLNGYGWIDPNAGVVRIPVERAMDLVLKEGIPARPEKRR